MKDYNYNKIYCNQVIEGFRLDRSLQLGEATQGVVAIVVVPTRFAMIF